MAPQNGSVDGGDVLTISGVGFGSAAETFVFLGDVPCDISLVNFTYLTCVTRQNSSQVSSISSNLCWCTLVWRIAPSPDRFSFTDRERDNLCAEQTLYLCGMWAVEIRSAGLTLRRGF